jgi:Rv2525c-like, glycoside hydrolase-like domain
MTSRWKIVPLVLLLSAVICGAQTQGSAEKSYAGFDRNDFPGDANLTALRKSFRFTSYWLNNPPGAQHNTWAGKHALLKKNGFGFLVLFNGRLYQDLKGRDATALGAADGNAATAAALHEGFARNTLIFLDQEQGGRLLPEQADYLFAWIDAVRAAGGRAGIYCSGIEVPDGTGTISTARDIVEKEKARVAQSSAQKAAPQLQLWVVNDQCPPSPGCSTTHTPMSTAVPPELASSMLVWQYAQSPRRAQFTSGCPANYAPDNLCYAPGLAPGPDTFVDLDVANAPDPSSAR